MRTYFTWYWLKRNDLSYLDGITQSSPMGVYEGTEYPYIVVFDHTPFLDYCYDNGIYVTLGIAIEGGNCFNFDIQSVSIPYQNFYLQTARKLATLYGNHPAVLGFCMGNEQNNPTVNGDSRTWLYYQSMYEAIKAAAPHKLVLIAFQDDQNLYNGKNKVKDKANQTPPTRFNGLPIEQVVSTVVDVWGLNAYAGITTDFPIYQQNVVEADNGAYARPLYVTEWGKAAGRNKGGLPGPATGNAEGEELSSDELTVNAKKITEYTNIMGSYISFIAGAFYFEFSDEWWKNTSFIPANCVSQFCDATQMFETNQDGTVSMEIDGIASSVYPAYPFVHDGSEDPNWPEEWWGLYGISPTGGRPAFAPDPGNPDTLTPRKPYVDALSVAYQSLGANYPAQNAEAFATMEDGVVVAVTVTQPGCGYTSPPIVAITPPDNGGAPAQATATVADGKVTGITVTDAGTRYDFGPQVSISRP